MITLKMILLPLLALTFLNNCSAPVDPETQAKARQVALANAVRKTSESSKIEEEQASEPDDQQAEESASRQEKDD